MKPTTLLVSMASMFTVGCGQATTIPSSAPVWTLVPQTTVESPTTTSVAPAADINPVSIIVPPADDDTPAPSTTSTIPGIDNARYPRILTVAHQIGWPAEWLPTLDIIIHRESRGIAGLNGSGGLGITQIEWVIWGDMANNMGYTRADVRDNNKANLDVALAVANTALDHYDYWCQPWYPSLGNYRKYC